MQIKDCPEYKRKGEVLMMAPHDSVASAVAILLVVITLVIAVNF